MKKAVQIRAAFFILHSPAVGLGYPIVLTITNR